MLSRLFKRKHDKPRIVYVRKSEWAPEDQMGAARFIESRTWERLVMRGQATLLERILAGMAGEEYRKGYLDAISDLQSVRAPETPDDEESIQVYPIQGVDDE